MLIQSDKIEKKNNTIIASPDTRFGIGQTYSDLVILFK